MSKISRSEIDKSLNIAVRSGKVLFGSNTAIKSAMAGKVKMIIVASNCPADKLEKIRYYCKLSNVPLLIYPGSSLDLGSACGKQFMVAALTIKDPGDSDILKFVGDRNV